MILAAVDIGTNTFRLLAASFERRGWIQKVLCSADRIVRLGEGLYPGGRLQPGAVGRALDTLREFTALLAPHAVDRVEAVATSAVREAADGPEFVRKVRAETGLEVRVLSAGDEARWTAEGILAGLPEPPGRFLTQDIGGGSTEFTWGEGERLFGVLSADLGVVRLTEQFGTSYASGRDEAVRRRILEVLEPVRRRMAETSPPGFAPRLLVGTAGTATTLAAMDLKLKAYDPAEVHLHRLRRETIERLYRELKARTPRERLALPGLVRGREDLILPGALILLLTLEMAGLDEMLVSDYGLREGILVNLLKTLRSP